jgi:hypothetical protein
VVCTDLQRTWNREERRQAARFSTALALTIGGTAGRTRDVSATGIFFFTRSHDVLTVGAPITFTLELTHADPNGVLEVACSGMIVRVEHGPDGIGVAACITSYDFTPYNFTGDSVRQDGALLPGRNGQRGSGMVPARNGGGHLP